MDKSEKLFAYWAFLAILMHIAGSSIHIGGVRLYDYWFIGGLLKYDMLAHFINSFFLVIVLSNILKIKKHWLILIVLGIGAGYELIELVSVVFFEGADKIGDYMNNALDNLFNFMGASLAYITCKVKKWIDTR